MITILEQLFGPFFDGQAWLVVLTSGEDWAIIASLAVIECLLSVDNAVVLAAQTQTLPTMRQQEQALLLGMWGSYILRFIMIGLGVYLINLWAIKVLGAAYLVFLSIHYFYGLYHKSPTPPTVVTAKQISFGGVVLQIIFMDAIFSVDSVLAALAVSDKPIIVLIGGCIGILIMRGVATIIITVMKKIPELETMAYWLILIIAIKLFVSIPQIGWEIPTSAFVVVIILAFIGAFVAHWWHQRQGRS